MGTFDRQIVLLQNGQAAYLGKNPCYLNDLIWHPKYNELGVYDVSKHQFSSRLKDFTDSYEHFLPIDFFQVKSLNSQKHVIASVVGQMLFMF